MKRVLNIFTMLLSVLCTLHAGQINTDDLSTITIDKFKKVAVAKWGADNVDLPSPCTWVEYEPDLGERFVVCFESGIVKVQTLLRESDNPESVAVMNHVRQGIRNLALTGGEDTYLRFNKEYSSDFEKDYPATYTVKKGDNLWVLSKRFRIKHGEIASLNKIDPNAVLQIGQILKLPSKPPHFIEEMGPSSLKGSSILIGQLELQDGTDVTPDNVDQFTKEMVSGGNHEVKRITGGDGVIRQELTVEFKLVDDHLQRRAEMYHPAVVQYANKYKLDEPTILALIHTESHFNPRARSSAPAFGLMQIVPATSGRDATKFLLGKEENLSSSYLYKPDNNIRIGAAYLYLLATRYWGEVKDPVSRQYCIIASYNGGSGNVARLFAGTKSRQNAIKKINTMSSAEVYKELCSNHRLQETRTYLRKVTERTPLYADK